MRLKAVVIIAHDSTYVCLYCLIPIHKKMENVSRTAAIVNIIDRYTIITLAGPYGFSETISSSASRISAKKVEIPSNPQRTTDAAAMISVPVRNVQQNMHFSSSGILALTILVLILLSLLSRNFYT